MSTYFDIAASNMVTLTLDNFQVAAFTDKLAYTVPADVKYARVFVRNAKFSNLINPNLDYKLDIVPINPRTGAFEVAANRINLVTQSQVGSGSGTVVTDFTGVADPSKLIFPGEKIVENSVNGYNTNEYSSVELYILEFK